MSLSRQIARAAARAEQIGLGFDIVGAFAQHGDYYRWAAAFDDSPFARTTHHVFGDTVVVGEHRELSSPIDAATLRERMLMLRPWRKGPFSVFGVDVDAEWRSWMKWHRVRAQIADLAGKHVLDVGCGNGYYGWRMLESGAAQVIGCDPTLNSVAQHLYIAAHLDAVEADRNVVLPCRVEHMPRTTAGFDTIFSMGVLYHCRDPEQHIAELADRLKPGGELVVESLVVSGRAPLRPLGRYARMRNVHIVPNEDTLVRWLEQARLSDVRIVDVSRTTPSEQRRTDWMTFDSLEAALDPKDARTTIEGHPAPLRAVAIARTST